MTTLTVLHGATMLPREMATLIGSTPGFTTTFPAAKANRRWDHIGNNDAPVLNALGGDYLCGFSSGAFMAVRMLHERKYKAAVIVSGGLLVHYLLGQWVPPCPIMLVHGTSDARVPYEGVPYAYEAGMDAALALRVMMGIPGPPRTKVINPSEDGCRVILDNWGPLRLYTIVNGGHTWPGSRYNGAGLGRTSFDVNITTEMLSFFKEFP